MLSDRSRITTARILLGRTDGTSVHDQLPSTFLVNLSTCRQDVASDGAAAITFQRLELGDRTRIVGSSPDHRVGILEILDVVDTWSWMHHLALLRQAVGDGPLLWLEQVLGVHDSWTELITERAALLAGIEVRVPQVRPAGLSVSEEGR